MHAIILAGGRGTRLQTIVNDVPKPLAPVNGVPFLVLQISYLAGFGVTDVILSVGYQHQKIIDCLGDSCKGVKLSYVIETEPLGTGGAIKLALNNISTDQPIFVLNGDTFSELNFNTMYEDFISSNKKIGIALTHVNDTSRFGAVTLSEDALDVLAFEEKNNLHEPGLINSGTYILFRDFFEDYNFAQAFSFEADCLYPLLPEIKCFPFVYEGTFIDIGIPEDYERAQIILANY